MTKFFKLILSVSLPHCVLIKNNNASFYAVVSNSYSLQNKNLQKITNVNKFGMKFACIFKGSEIFLGCAV